MKADQIAVAFQMTKSSYRQALEAFRYCGSEYPNIKNPFTTRLKNVRLVLPVTKPIS
jgi:hypothetical protein